MAVTNQVKTILLLGVLSAVRGVVSKAGMAA